MRESFSDLFTPTQKAQVVTRGAYSRDLTAAKLAKFAQPPTK